MASRSQLDACSADSLGSLDSLSDYLQKLQDELDQEAVSKDERHKFGVSAIQRMVMDDADGDYNNVAAGGGDDFYRHSDGVSDYGGARKECENFSDVAGMSSLKLDRSSPETRIVSNYESKREIHNYGSEEMFHGGGNILESISEYCLDGGSQPYYGQGESPHNEGSVRRGAVNYVSAEKYSDEGATSRGTGNYSQEDLFSREGDTSGSTDSHNSEEITNGCYDSRVSSKGSGSALVGDAYSKYLLGERFSTNRSPRSLLDTSSLRTGREGDNSWDPYAEVGERYQSSLLGLLNEASEDGGSEVSDLIEFSDEEDQSTASEPQHRGGEASNSYITTSLVKTNAISGRDSPSLTSKVERASIVSGEESEDEHQESFMSWDVEQSGLDEDDDENEPLEFQELVKYLERRTLRRQISEMCSPIVRSPKVVAVEEEEVIQNDQTSHWLQMDQTNKTPKEFPTTKVVVASKEVRFGSTDCNTEDLEVEHTLGLQNFHTIPNTHNLNICATDTTTISYGINNPRPPEHEVTTTLENITLPDEIIERSPEFEHLTVKAIAESKPLAQTSGYRVIPMTSSQRTYDRKARRARAKERSLAMLLRTKSQIRSSDTTNSSITSAHTPSLESVKIHHNREIRIGNLPRSLTLKTILSKVRGGLLDRVSYRKSQHTVIIVFFDPDAASNFYQHILTFPLTYPTTNNPLASQRFVNIFPFAQANTVEPNTLEIREAISHGATRCIFLGFLPASIGIRKIQSDIMERFGEFQNGMNWAGINDELIESIEVVPDPDRLRRATCSHFRETEGKGKFEGTRDGMSVIVRLSSINVAFEAIGYFGTLPAYFCVELAFVEDECAGPLERPAAAMLSMGGPNHRLGDNSSLHCVASVKPGYLQPGRFTAPSQPPIQQAHLFASINSRACQSSDASQPPDSNIVYLGNLPPNITFQTLARWIRGGNVDTIHLYSDTEYPTKEAVIFFVASKSARQYHKFIATHGMFISGRKILALTYIPNHIKTAHNPLSFLQGYPRNGITRFVKIWDVRDPQQLLGCIVGFCDQGLAVEEVEDKITKGVRNSITIHFMGMRDALRTVYQLKRFDCYRGLRTAYVRDPCDGDVMELVRREGQRGR